MVNLAVWIGKRIGTQPVSRPSQPRSIVPVIISHRSPAPVVRTAPYVSHVLAGEEVEAVLEEDDAPCREASKARRALPVSRETPHVVTVLADRV